MGKDERRGVDAKTELIIQCYEELRTKEIPPPSVAIDRPYATWSTVRVVDADDV